MKFFLATNKLHDIESIVAAKEQQRLQDLLVFVSPYLIGRFHLLRLVSQTFRIASELNRAGNGCCLRLFLLSY